MGCVNLGEKNCIHLPSVGEQTANQLPNFTQPKGSNISGPSICSLSGTKCDAITWQLDSQQPNQFRPACLPAFGARATASSAAAHSRPAAYCGKTPLVLADADGGSAAHVNVGCGVRRGYTQTEIRGGKR